MPATTNNNEVVRQQLIAFRRAAVTLFTDGIEDTSEGELFGRVTETIPSTSRGTDYEWLTDFSDVREWIGERQFNDFKAYEYSIDNRDWETSLAVKRNDLEDGRLGIYTRRISRMVDNFRLHRRRLLVDLIEKNDTCYDGKPFFATDHPIYKRKGGTDENKWVESATQRNLITLKLEPTYEVAKHMMDFVIPHMSMMKADNGRIVNVQPNLLVVPMRLLGTANELATSSVLPRTLAGGDTVMAPNPMQGVVEVVAERNLTGSNGWYLIDGSNPVLFPFIYQLRQGVRFDGFDAGEAARYHVFMQKEYVYGADARYNVGYGLYQAALRSDGSTAVGSVDDSIYDLEA
ncbi:structural protein [Salinibacter phage M8CC-19]|uniref:Structural protein n=2 Tax=Kryptosalinivirus M8CC19 TaxID=2560720 RepID=A0A2I6UG42_9CAUD|nr:major head protein [Salinibacter phage M8CC-19]AUO78963.1 structural protein [Salinibacter phage M8CC-19]AUO79197.1 structural protein [Salinibacter phage M31CC-1]